VLILKFEWLESFRVFAEEMNFTRAAEIRHISQPAFFRQIQNLSDHLGLQLYVKTGRNIQLTGSGEEVAIFAREMSERVNLFKRRLDLSIPAPQISVAAGHGCYLYLLGRGIKTFTAKASSKLKLLITNRDETLQHLRTGSAHIGITVLSNLPEDLQGTVIRRIRPVLVIPNHHRLAQHKSISVEQFKELSFVIPPEPSDLRATIFRLCQEHNFVPNISVEASGWELMIHFVAVGLGAAVVNSCCKLQKGVVGIPIKQMSSTDYYLLHRKDQHLFDELKLLKKTLIQQVSKEEIF
jgi:LysR family transcriptional regulator, low CO2-responsive transcriptional regulator